MVIDTSTILAIFFNEEKGPWVKEQLEKHSSSLCMSTVNLAEVLILIQNRQPHLFSEVREEILNSSIRFVAPSVSPTRLQLRKITLY